MKDIIKIMLMLGLFSKLSFSQINWDPDYESANFAFLKVDFNTYDFEGGYFTKFDYHPGFDKTGIPFSIVYNPPLDTGDILFAYSATDDTIFAASIWWAGQGQILFPDSIDDASLFTYDSTLAILPFSIEYFKYVEENIEDSVFRRKADSAWLAIKQLSILERFDTLGSVFRVGLYLYAPAVGSFNPDVAKWIIFLYRGQLILGVEEGIEVPNYFQVYQNYPNPFNPSTTIKFNLPENALVQLTVYDILGRKIIDLVDEELPASSYSINFDGKNLSSGIYIYRITAMSKREILYSSSKEMILLK